MTNFKFSIFLMCLILLQPVLTEEKYKRNHVSENFKDNIYFHWCYGPTLNDYATLSYREGLSRIDNDKVGIDSKNISGQGTVFLLPGYYEDVESVDTIVEAFLTRSKLESLNVIVVDYSKLLVRERPTYVAFKNIKLIGVALGLFLNKFIPTVQKNDQVHLIGIGLGSLIMSKAAKSFEQGKLYWLTALGPVGPGFHNYPLADQLSKEDAVFVDVIHTDGRSLGDSRSMGHVDFFPNIKENIQPACVNSTDISNCNHQMAWEYYAESIINKNAFPAKKCNVIGFNQKFDVLDIRCEKNAIVNHMGLNVNKYARGNFYLKTNSESYFDMGEMGFYDSNTKTDPRLEILNPQHIPLYFIKNIYFNLHYGPITHEYEQIRYVEGLSIAKKSQFDSKKQTVFYLTGWGNLAVNKPNIEPIVEAFLTQKESFNIIVVDYSEVLRHKTAPGFPGAVRNMTYIGAALGWFLKKFIPAVQKIDKVHLIGTELGCHIMSKTAKIFGQGELYWLTALSPAGPDFHQFPLIELTKEDAIFVDVIHTGGRWLGDNRSIGHVDFYVNLHQNIQPFCVNVTHHNNDCNLNLAAQYYAESVKNKKAFPAKKCNIFGYKYSIFKNNIDICCEKNAPVTYMGLSVDKYARGNFYLRTDDKEPFGLKEKGFYPNCEDKSRRKKH